MHKTQDYAELAYPHWLSFLYEVEELWPAPSLFEYESTVFCVSSVRTATNHDYLVQKLP